MFVHGLIADYYSGKRSGSDIELEYLRRFRDEVRSPAPGLKVFQSYFEDGLTYLKNIEPPADRVLAVEKEVGFSVLGVPFRGCVDRVDVGGDGRLLLIDNKSRKLKPRSGKDKPTKSDEELDGYLKQLYLTT